MPLSSFVRRVVVAVACLFVASIATAAPKPKSNASTGHQSGVRIYVDPQTGRRTTTPSNEARRNVEAQAARDPAFNQSSDGLVERPLPSGGGIVDLQGRFQSTVGVKVGKDGKRELYCDEAAHEALPAAPAAKREER